MPQTHEAMSPIYKHLADDKAKSLIIPQNKIRIYMQTLSERLIARMDELKLSKTDLVIKTGYTQLTISAVLLWSAIFPTLTTSSVCQMALDCTTDYLIHGRIYDTSFITNNLFIKKIADGLLGMNEEQKEALLNHNQFMIGGGYGKAHCH